MGVTAATPGRPLGQQGPAPSHQEFIPRPTQAPGMALMRSGWATPVSGTLWQTSEGASEFTDVAVPEGQGQDGWVRRPPLAGSRQGPCGNTKDFSSPHAQYKPGMRRGR